MCSPKHNHWMNPKMIDENAIWNMNLKLRWVENTSRNGYGSNHAWKHSKDMKMDASNQTNNANLEWECNIKTRMKTTTKGYL